MSAQNKRMPHSLITKAAAFAAEAHSKQRRKAIDQPYINHLLRVADEASKADLSIEAIAAGLLHDVVEDTAVTYEELRGRFSERTIHLVKLLTKWWSDDASKEEKRVEKVKYYAAILTDLDAVHLKLLDRADNLNDMSRMLPKARGWAERYLRKTVVEISPLFEKSVNKIVQKRYLSCLRKLQSQLEHKVEKKAKKKKK